MACGATKDSQRVASASRLPLHVRNRKLAYAVRRPPAALDCRISLREAATALAAARARLVPRRSASELRNVACLARDIRIRVDASRPPP